MPVPEGEIAKRQLVLFFLIDTSGSMFDDKIAAVNTAMRELLPELQNLADEKKNARSEIEIAVLEFNNSATWKTPKPIPVKTYVWTELTASGGTNLGAACEKLDQELQRGKFLWDYNLFAPVLILMSDGYPNSGYEIGLGELKKNEFFANKDSKGKFKEKSVKVACAIETDNDKADKDVLAQFTENPELVYTAKTITALKNWIKFIAVASSVARMHNDGPETMSDKLKKFEEEEGKVTVSSAGKF
jgi:uncharacterized protein YegL